MAAEYGWPETTIRRMPLARLFACYHAAAMRNGCQVPGPTLVDKAYLKAKRAAKARLQGGQR